MASTANPTSNAVAEWLRVFQALGTESYTSSVTFMKQLTVIALSTITYMKNAFPEENYTVASFSNLKLKILKKTCDDQLAQFLSTSIAQAFDAFDKKYLHQLVLCFYEEECLIDNLLEYYIFEYSYSPEGTTMNIQSRNRKNEKKTVKCTFEDVERQTTQLLRACIVMMQASPRGLPRDADISIRLYYNDDAPEGYQAPGFSRPTGADHVAPTLRGTVLLGAVTSAHHRLLARSYVRETAASGEAEPSQNAPMMTQSTFSRSVSDCSGPRLRCPCNKYEDSEEVLITCFYCSTQQHAVCFGLLPQDVPNVAKHCCTTCSDTKQRAPSDQWLASLSDKKRESLCIFRRALAWLSTLGAVSGASVAARFALSGGSVAKLMRTLQDRGVIADWDDDLTTTKQINHEALKPDLERYFQCKEAADNPPPLAGSQESLPDPVGDVLSPLEKVSLQNDSNIGRVIPNPMLNKTTNRDIEDEVLKQYRNAISSSAETVVLGERGAEQVGDFSSGKSYTVEHRPPPQDVQDTEMKCSVKRKLEEAGGRQLRSGVKTKKLKQN